MKPHLSSSPLRWHGSKLGYTHVYPHIQWFIITWQWQLFYPTYPTSGFPLSICGWHRSFLKHRFSGNTLWETLTYIAIKNGPVETVSFFPWKMHCDFPVRYVTVTSGNIYIHDDSPNPYPYPTRWTNGEVGDWTNGLNIMDLVSKETFRTTLSSLGHLGWLVMFWGETLSFWIDVWFIYERFMVY